MKRIGLFIFIALIFSCTMSFGQEIYHWVDEKGTVHYTDDPSLIPEKYQDQVSKKKAPVEPPPVSSIKEPKGRTSPGPDVEKKDFLGHGEDWWRDKAMEWKQKLIKAQKDYVDAETALKAKEKELEDAKFKPKSFQRKLQEEIKVLEEKADEQIRLVDEAKNMLEKVLPRQAEEYRADPSWVKID